MGQPKANNITHVVFILDGSDSMSRHADGLVKATDALVKRLAEQSTLEDQETRVTIYVFRDQQVDCVVYDKDVLRTPSMANVYHASGGTPLIAATLRAFDDAALIPEKYGSHAHLFFVLTDGDENTSHYVLGGRRTEVVSQLVTRMGQLPDNWTVAALVPDIMGKVTATRYGFPKDNIALWDATSERGLEEATEAIAVAASGYMAARTKTGLRSTKTLFAGNDVLNTQTVAAAKVTQLDPANYRFVPIQIKSEGVEKMAIRDFVLKYSGMEYRVGRNFYELTKRERIGPEKEIILLRKNGPDKGKMFGGPEIRSLLKLPKDVEVSVTPADNSDYKIFVQSTANNRHILDNTTLLVQVK